MLRPWKIGKFFGVETFLHWSFVLLPLYLLFINRSLGLLSAAAAAFAGFFVLFFVLLHEFGHVLAARAFGIPTQSVTLYPIGGVALMTRQAHNPFEEIIIAVAGPAVNLVLAILLGLGKALVGIPFVDLPELAQGIKSLATFYQYLFVINIGLLVFNLLPAFPMDGGRVVRAFLWFFTDLITATRVASYVAIPIALLLALLGLLTGNILTIFIAGLVVLLGQFELWALRMRLAEKQRREAYAASMQAPVSTVEYANGIARQPPELNFDGYTWDAHEQGWVEWRAGRAIRFYRTRHW